MKLSISNLAWNSSTTLEEVIPKLSKAGMNGIEIAPTKIWPDIEDITSQDISDFRKKLEDNDLVVSGIQSLMFGHPEFQLFQESTWASMLNHLEKMIDLAGSLGASVAVFGSPKNRIKGDLSVLEANELAATFLKKLVPCLSENNVTLTLEPNAPAYGADFLITYQDVIDLSLEIDSKRIRPQIDTGCLWMAGVEPSNAYNLMAPEHVHLSVPNLEIVPGEKDFSSFLNLVNQSDYKGWLVIEMLDNEANSLSQTIESAEWLFSCIEKH